MDITLAETIEDAETIIEAGTAGTFIGEDELGQSWFSFRVSPNETVLYPFTADELAEQA